MFGHKSDKSSKGKRFEIIYEEYASGCRVLVDKETGVHYLFSWAGYAGGITPLLDKDGKPVIKLDNE